MLIIPAIDLKNHQVVRLSQGLMDSSTVYTDDPVAQASLWIEKGAERLHLVDLNGAFEGKPIHFDEIEKISRKYPHVRIEIGGGIRDLQTIERYFDVGVHYCILGTIAIKKPELVCQAASQYPHRIILGVDAKNEFVATEGWDQVSHQTSLQVIESFRGNAIFEVIYTDIAKDGMLQGMNLEQIKCVAAQSSFPIVASGGFTSLNDLDELSGVDNISGVIAGKALYEGLVDLEAAIQKVKGFTC